MGAARETPATSENPEEPFWKSKPLQVLALASAAVGVILTGAGTLSIPLAPVALSLLVLAAVYALIAIAAEAADYFPPIRDELKRRRESAEDLERQLVLQRSRDGKLAAAEETPQKLQAPLRFAVLRWGRAVQVLALFVLLVVAIVAPLVTPLKSEDVVDDPMAARALAVSICLLLVLVGILLVLIVVALLDARTIATVYAWATGIAFVLCLVGVATPFVSYAARELPLAGDQIGKGLAGDDPPDIPPHHGGDGGNARAYAYAQALSDPQVAQLAEAIRSLAQPQGGGRGGGLTESQFEFLLNAISDRNELSEEQFQQLLAAINQRGVKRPPSVFFPDGDLSLLTDDQVDRLAAAIRDSRPAPVHVSVDATSAASSTTIDNSMWRIDHPPQRRVRRQCTFPRPATP